MARRSLIARKMVMIAVPILMAMALLIVGARSHAGSTSASGDVPFCHSDELLADSLRANPALKKTLDTQEEAIRNYVQKFSSKRQELQAAASNYVIPVVVYIVHNGGPENITDQQVNSQITALNTAFSGHGIEFCLATKQGAASLPGPTPGIIRISSTLTNHDTATEESALKDLPNPDLAGDRYLRLWVVNDIDNNSGVVGYARFPGTVPVALEGIVMRYDVFGDVATCGCSNLLPNYNQGKILAHEVGHYLNLFHTFHGGCSGIFPSDCATAGDRVCDTPQIAVANTGCPGLGTVFSCDGTPAPIDNHMNYTDDTCRMAFKPGQEARMLATLNTARQLLVSPQNLVFTGVQCAGLVNASFSADNYNPCTNQVITFDGLNTPGATYAWDFGDGGTGSGDPVTHSYASAGAYSVTLTLTSGSDSVSSTQQIFVTACAPINSTQGNWYFGHKAGLNFSSGSPVVDLNSAMDAEEACVTQSTSAGALLFYSNGVNVYDKNHALMNAGTPLAGGLSVTQGALSVPDPGNPNRYYLFILGPFGLSYSVVDFTDPLFPDGKLAAVNTQVSSGFSTSEQMTAVPKCAGMGYWLIIHGNSQPNNLYVYSVTAGSGVTFSNIYAVALQGFFGSLKASPDGTMLAQATLNNASTPTVVAAALYNFNRATGAITLRSVLPKGRYGCSFSPDSKLLYVTGDLSTGFAGLIYQYDLTAANPASTEAVLSDVPPSQSSIALQLGPDGKIYVAYFTLSSFSGALSVINYPNNRNTPAQPNACGFSLNGPFLQGRRSFLGLPNMIDALPPTQIPPAFSYSISSCSTVNFSAPACATSYFWDFGDSTTSNAQNPTHSYAFNGAAYTVTVKLTLNGSTTVTHAITIGLPASSATIFGPSQVCLASGNPAFYNYSANAPPGLTYNWTVAGGTISGPGNSDNVDVVWTSLPGLVELTVSDPATGCTATKTLSVIQNCNPNQCVTPPAQIVNWWTFDETSGTTAQDIRGFVNNAGTYVNGPTAVAGVVGGALSFSGSNWLEVANNPEVNFLDACILDFAEPMTIDLWVKTNIQPGTGPNSGLLTILDKRVNATNPDGYHLFLFNGRFGFQMGGINFVAPASGSNYIDVADNQWHFVAVSLPMCRGVGDGFLYVDGKTVLTLPRGLGFDNTAKLYIGRRDPAIAFAPNFFKGSLDELEMFKSALSDDQLRALFEARSRGKCKVDCSTKTITINPAFLPQLTWPVNAPYPTVTLTGSGGTAPYSFAVTGGSLPPGMTLDSLGTLSGAATQLGIYSFTVTAIDADGCRATRNYQLRIICLGISPPAGLVNWWPFDEETGTIANDIRASVNNYGVYGSGSASPTPTKHGMVKNALRFDGIDDFVEVGLPNDPEINFLGLLCGVTTPESFTIDVWVKTTAKTGLQVILDKRANPSQPIGYHLFLNKGLLGFQMNGVNFVEPVTEPNVADGNWHFIAVTVTRCPSVGAIGKLYVDKSLVLTFSPPTGSLNNSAKLQIGRRDPVFSGLAYFKGCLDELEIFKRDLSAKELLAIYNAGSAGKCKTAPCDLPSITLQPSNQVACIGGGATFTAAAVGNPSPAVQWQISTDGGATFTNINGATGFALTTSVAGFYRAVFTNQCGAATTSAARLTVSPIACGNG